MDGAVELEQQLMDLATRPVSGDAPCGASVKYEESFQQLEAELAKQESLTAATVDWELVEKLARDILANESKDLLVACYLVAALGQNRGYEGLTQGFILLRNLVEPWWEPMFPPIKRLRGRSAAIAWLVEKTGQRLDAAPPEGRELALVPDLYDAVSSLDQWLAEKMEDKAPNMMELVRPLRNLNKSVKADLERQKKAEEKADKAASEPETANEASGDKPSAATAPSATSKPAAPAVETAAAVGSDSDANKAIRQLQDALRKLSGFYADKDPAQVRAIRFSRYSLWLTIDAVPPNKDGQTQVPPPSKDAQAKAEQLMQQGQYAEVVAQVEKQLAKLPYWFEGQRLSASAMEQLGAPYQAALTALKAELRALLERVPGLMDLSFNDGSPFVPEATRFWLTETVLAGDDAGGASGSAGSDALADALANAKKQAASGKVAEAVSALNDFARGCASRRDEFQARLALAELLLDSGNRGAALPILMRLTDHLERNGLADWEPDFTRQAYGALHRACTKRAKGDKPLTASEEEKQALAYAELCWHDPGSAVT